MATPTRVIYQSLALYASQVPSTAEQTGVNTVRELSRTQTFSDDWSRNITDVLQYGDLNAIDRVDTEGPTVNASFSYYPTDGLNEKLIGFVVTTGNQSPVSCISGLVSNASNDKNYYLLITEQGSDANNYQGSQSGVIGIGNGYITAYNLNGAVSELLTASIDLVGLNAAVYADIDGTNASPAIIQQSGVPASNLFVLPPGQTNQYAGQISAIQPGDIKLDLAGNFGFPLTGLNVQSFDLGLDLGRTPINRLGNRFAFSQEIDFPKYATFTVEAQFVNEQNFNLYDLLCSGNYNLTLRFNKPSCSGVNAEAGFIVTLNGAKILSSNVDTSIGANATVSAEYQIPLGAASTTGVFFSGSFPSSAA